MENTQKHSLEKIANLERSEEQRYQKAVAAMDQVERETKEAYGKERQELDESLRAKALQELRSYKEKELPEIFHAEHDKITKDCAAVDAAVDAKMPATVERLTKELLSPSFFLHL